MSSLTLLPLNGSGFVDITIDRKSLPNDIDEHFDMESNPKVLRFLRRGHEMVIKIHPNRITIKLSAAINVDLGVEGDSYTLRPY